MKAIEWLDVIRTAYQEFDIYPKGTVAQLEAELEQWRLRFADVMCGECMNSGLDCECDDYCAWQRDAQEDMMKDEH